jgi:hypothetical protein
VCAAGRMQGRGEGPMGQEGDLPWGVVVGFGECMAVHARAQRRLGKEACPRLTGGVMQEQVAGDG